LWAGAHLVGNNLFRKVFEGGGDRNVQAPKIVFLRKTEIEIVYPAEIKLLKNEKMEKCVLFFRKKLVVTETVKMVESGKPFVNDCFIINC